MIDLTKIFQVKNIFKWFFEIFEFYFLPRKFFRQLFSQTEEEKIAQCCFYVVLSCLAITAISIGISDTPFSWTLWMMFKNNLIHIFYFFLIFIVIYAGNKNNANVSFVNIVIYSFTILSLFEPLRFYFYCEFLIRENFNYYLASNVVIVTEAIFITILSPIIFYSKFKIILLKLFLLWFAGNIGGALLNSASKGTGDTAYIPSGPEPIYGEYLNIIHGLQTAHTALLAYHYDGEECYGISANGKLMQDYNSYVTFYDKIKEDLLWIKMCSDSARYLRNKKALIKHSILYSSMVQAFASRTIGYKVNKNRETYFIDTGKAREEFVQLYNDAFEEEVNYHNIVSRATVPFWFFNYYYYIRRKLNGERAWLILPDQEIGTLDKMTEDDLKDYR